MHLPLSDLQMEALSITGSELFARLVVENAQAIADLREWIEFVSYDSVETASFMDATTLHRVAHLAGVATTGPRFLTDAFLFWDLSTFVNAVVLSDKVFHIETRWLDSLKLNEAIGGEPVIVPIPQPMPKSAVEKYLWALWFESKRFLDALERVRDEYWESIQAGWRALFYQSSHTIPLFDDRFLQRHYSSEYMVWRQLNRPNYYASLRQAFIGSNNYDHNKACEYVVENTARGIFNFRLAEAIGLPYYPSTLRLPVLSAFNRQASSLIFHLPRLDEMIDREFSQVVSSYKRFSPLTMPLFFTALMKRVSSRSDLLPALGELRSEAAPLRRRRRELEDAFALGSALEIDALRGALQDQANNLFTKWGIPLAVGTTAAIVAILPSIGMLSTSRLLLISMLSGALNIKPKWLSSTTRLVLKPHFYFISNVASEAREALNIWPELGKIFPINVEDDILTRQIEAIKQWGRMHS